MSGVDFFVIVEGEASVTVRGKEVDTLARGITSASLPSLPSESASRP